VVTLRPWTRWQDWVRAALGAWLFVSAWVLGTAAETMAGAWNFWIVGLAVVLVSLWALYMPGEQLPHWIGLLLGAWVFVSPWAFGLVLQPAGWSAWIVGLAVVVLSGWVLMELRGGPRAQAQG
jgi:membrane associated rhomboid family serine protease